MKIRIISVCILSLNSMLSSGQIGKLDPDFGSNGKVLTSVGPLNDQGNCIAVYPDDRFLVCGSTGATIENLNFAIVRYLPNGAIDASFAENGMMIEDICTSRDVIISTVIQNDAKILVTGFTYSNDTDIIVARYNPEGSIDATFGNNGKLFFDLSDRFERSSAIILQNDNIIIGGITRSTSADYKIFLIKVDKNGLPVPQFGSSGIVLTGIANEGCMLNDIELQHDGKILALGSVGKTDAGNGDILDALLVRYNSDGSLDGSFNNSGITITSFADATDVPNSILIQPGNKIIISGTAYKSNDMGFEMMRFNEDGSIDTSFGDMGIVITDLDNSWNNSSSSLVQPDGKIILGGYILRNSKQSYCFCTARYSSNGILDSLYGTDGWTWTSVGNGTDVFSSGMAFQSNYDIILTGSYLDPTPFKFDFATVRYIGDHNLGLPQDIVPQYVEMEIFPNPSNASAVLHYNLTEPDIITIEMFDLNGRKVISFIDNELINQGEHTQILNLNPIRSGSYILKLSAKKNSGAIQLLKE